MSQQLEVHAQLRTDVGKGASRRLRRDAKKVPGILYGGDAAPQMLALDTNALEKLLHQEAFFSQVLNLVVDGKKESAVLRDLQRNPANEKPVHIDFLRVQADRVIEMSVPLHFLNEEICIGVRQGGGAISHNLTEVEISCLPSRLPEFIELDIANLDLGESIHLSDLVFPEGVTSTQLALGPDHDQPVVSVIAPRGGSQEEEEAEAAEAAVEIEARPTAEGEEG
jgi:large subunit ribosomal protein L25